MSDVSTRAFGFFLAFERDGRLDVARLLEGLPVTRAELESARGRVPWDVWAEICDRFGATMRTPEAVEASGAAVIEPRYLGPLLGIVGLFTDARDIYRVGFRWFAPMMYRNLRFTMVDVPGAPLELTVEIPDGARGSEAYLQMTVGGLRAIPRLLGLPDANVVAELTPRRGRFVVTPPPPRSARTWLGRAVAAVRGAGAVVAELAEQQGRLAESYAALARVERGFRSVLEALPVAVGVHRDGTLVYASAALERLAPAAGPRLVGKPLDALVHADDRARLDALLRDSDAATVVELRLAGEGAPVHAECGVLDGFVFDGRPAGLFFAIDLTARRAAQDALARSEEITRVLLEVLPDLVLRLDREGTLLEFRGGRAHPNTEVFASLLGVSVLRFVDLLPDISRGLVEDGMAKVVEAIETGAETSYYVRSSALGPPERHYDCRIFPEGGGEAVVLVRDVTEQRRLQEQLAIAERMATLGTVAAGVAHELNNPLTYVVANVSLALEALDAAERGDAADLAALRQGLVDARSGAERAQRIVSDLRVFSRGGATEERRPVDVREVLASVVAMTQTEVRTRAQLHLTVEDTVRVDADASRLGQVFVNLVINAAEAVPEGETGHHVRIHARVDSAGAQEVTVHDDGIGMDVDALGGVFRPFVTTKTGGTGLGLAICHRIVTELGGTIDVESAPGAGTTFRVCLPPSTSASPTPSTPAPKRPSSLAPRTGHARILFVDDEPLVARAVVRTLAQHDVTWVASGEEAVARMRTEPFDLVLCDLMLGGMSGLDVRDAVRRERPALADRFLFLSGGALTARSRDLLASEPERCLSKPVTPRELRERVAEELARLF